MALNLTTAVAAGKGWKPGQSGNPAGRKAVRNAAEIARGYAPDAFRALVLALHSKGERVAAAREILDRAYGKPNVSVDVNSEQSITVLHLLAAMKVSDELHAEENPSPAQQTIEGSIDPMTAPPPSE